MPNPSFERTCAKNRAGRSIQTLGARMISLQELCDIEARARGNDPDALYQSGLMYWTGRWIEGRVIPQCKSVALKMIQRAADHGHEAAALFIAEHRKIPNADVEHYDSSKSDDAQSANGITSVSGKTAQSAEIPFQTRDQCVVRDLETIEPWLHETVTSLNGHFVTRVRSSLFYWGALVSFMLGIYLLKQDMPVGGFLILTLAPFLLLYPPIRFLLGGKDSLAGVIVSFIIEELIKREIFKALDDSSRRRRK